MYSVVDASVIPKKSTSEQRHSKGRKDSSSAFKNWATRSTGARTTCESKLEMNASADFFSHTYRNVMTDPLILVLIRCATAPREAGH